MDKSYTTHSFDLYTPIMEMARQAVDKALEEKIICCNGCGSVQRKAGRWDRIMHTNNVYRCSVCGYMVIQGALGTWEGSNLPPYCPNCGSQKKGDAE